MTYDTMIDDSQRFCRALAADNTKAWWDAHKAVYDRDLRTPALGLLAELTPRLSDLTGDPMTPKLFRPHRDVRFSADKRPYKDHLHMIWHQNAGGRQDPGYFFGIGVDSVTIGAGIMEFDRPMLEVWRKFVDLDAARIGPMLDRLQGQGWTFWEPDLKRVPAGYAPDHPLGYFLRMKGAVATRDLTGTDALPDRIMAGFAQVKPFADLLVSVACA